MSLSSQPNQNLPHSLGTGGAVLQVGVAKTTEGMSAGLGFCQEGKRREDREANDDGAKQQNEDGVAERGISADVAE